MTRTEINTFIVTFCVIGDEWTPDLVEEIYKNKKLDE